MNHSDLVTRLRNGDDNFGVLHHGDLGRAADKIECLEASNYRLVAALREIISERRVGKVDEIATEALACGTLRGEKP